MNNEFCDIAKSLDNSSPEEVKTRIESLTNFLDSAREAASFIRDSFDTVIDADIESANKVNASYTLLIDSLNENLQDEELNFDQKIEIMKLMRDVVRDQELFNQSQIEKRHELYKQIAGGILTATVSIVGIITKVYGSKVPSITNEPTNHS